MARIYVRPAKTEVVQKPKESVASLAGRLKHQHRYAFDEKYKARFDEKSRKKKKLRFIRKTAERLSANLPKSEVWFWEEWEKLGMLTELETDNEPFCGRIPDVLNRRHEYVIEIDGSVHQRANVKARDQKKEFTYQGRGFAYWRINHGDMDRLRLVAMQVKQRRSLMERRIARNGAIV